MGPGSGKGEVTLRLLACWVLVHFCVCKAGQINRKTTAGGRQNCGRWQGLGAAFREVASGLCQELLLPRGGTWA